MASRDNYELIAMWPLIERKLDALEHDVHRHGGLHAARDRTAPPKIEGHMTSASTLGLSPQGRAERPLCVTRPEAMNTIKDRTQQCFVCRPCVRLSAQAVILGLPSTMAA